MALGEDDSYQLMEPFLKAFEEKHPGSVTSLEKDEEGRFKRCCIVPHACAVAACRTPKQLLMMDGFFQKGSWNGTGLVFTVGSANGELSVVCL
ncbi:unnamed protein product, partial [Phaeothamnion confervicola]